MSEHHDAPKAHEPHALHEEHVKGPHNPKEGQTQQRCHQGQSEDAISPFLWSSSRSGPTVVAKLSRFATNCRSADMGQTHVADVGNKTVLNAVCFATISIRTGPFALSLANSEVVRLPPVTAMLGLGPEGTSFREWTVPGEGNTVGNG